MKRVYKYYQPNEKDKKDVYGDCVIRAITKITNKTWIEVFDDLCYYARIAQCLPNQPDAYNPYLKSLGYTYYPLKRKPKMTTLMEFRKNYKNSAICNVKVGYGSHFVAIQDGCIYDTWNCSDRYMYGYYAK